MGFVQGSWKHLDVSLLPFEDINSSTSSRRRSIPLKEESIRGGGGLFVVCCFSFYFVIKQSNTHPSSIPILKED